MPFDLDIVKAWEGLIGDRITFPVDGQKKPTVATWKYLAEDVFDQYAIAYGVKLGNGVIAIDVDCKKIDGFATLEALESELGELPITTRTLTPSGGIHLYFSVPLATVGCLNGWRPGIDVKGLGGYVVIPGSDGYTLEVDAPLAELPASWLARMPPEKRGAALYDVDPDEEDSDPRRAIAEAIKGKSGATWDAWRIVLLGELPFTHSIAEREAGGVDNFIRLHLFARLAELAPSISGKQMSEVWRPSLSLWARECLLANPRAPTKWDEPTVATKWEAARSAALARIEEKQKLAAQFSDFRSRVGTGDDLPIILTHAGAHYLRYPNERRYHGPIKRGDLFVWIRDHWSDDYALRDGKNGPIARTPNDLMETYGQHGAIADVTIDLTATEARIAEGVLFNPASGRLPEARRSEKTEAWLRAFLGEHYDLVLDWIAVSGVESLDTVVPVLVLLGSPGAGKTLFSDALSLSHGFDAAVNPSSAFGNFNQAGTCSVLFFDEKIAKFAGESVFDRLKELVTQRVRRVNPKGLPEYVVRGAWRILVAANDERAVFSTIGAMNEASLQATAERFLIANIDGSARSRAQNIIAPSELDRARLEAVAGHFRWLQTTRHVAPSLDRFRVKGNVRETLVAELRKEQPFVSEIVEALEMDGSIFECDGDLYARLSILMGARSLERSRATRADVKTFLVSHCGAVEWRPRLARGEQPRCLRLDRAALERLGVEVRAVDEDRALSLSERLRKN